LFACSASLVACASILGIDDGTARADGGVSDATLDVVIPGDSGGEGGGDATPDVIVDAGPDVPVDAPPAYSPLTCGSSTCNAVTQGCCRKGYGDDASPFTYACVNNGGTCASNGAIVVRCGSVANCAAQGKPGTVCCANSYNDMATAVDCLAPASCPDDAATLLCGPGDNALCAAHGWACLPSAYTIVGWDICK
jgi:hypothetical protein